METPSWMKKDFLEHLLCKNSDDPSITVESFKVRPTTTKGDNYASIIHRVEVTYRDGKGNHAKNLIVKSLPANELVQFYLKEMRFFDKEIAAYSKLLPAMSNHSETPLVCPTFYATDRADTVILEDLTPRGFKMADRKKRLDLAHSFLALKALARFHGLSYAVVQTDPSILDHFSESVVSDRMKEADEKLIPKLYKDLASIIETWPGYEKFSEKILTRSAEIKKEEKECLVPKKGAFNVLIHGDCWVNNMLFRYNEETENVEDVCLIDLQIIKYTSPAIDLQYFLTSSLADGIRDEHEDRLLEVYHKALTETLESAGLDSSVYSLDDLKKDYEEKGPYGFQAGILVLGAVASEPSEAFDFDGFTEDSLKDDAVNPMGKTLRGKGYRHVFQKHLLYYEKKGVI